LGHSEEPAGFFFNAEKIFEFDLTPVLDSHWVSYDVPRIFVAEGKPPLQMMVYPRKK